MRMTAIGVCGIEKPQPMVVPIQKHLRKPFDSESSLMRVVPNAHGTGAHRQTAGADRGIAKHDGVRCADFLRKLWHGQRPATHFRREPSGAGSIGCGGEKFSSLHGNLLGCTVLDVQTCCLGSLARRKKYTLVILNRNCAIQIRVFRGSGEFLKRRIAQPCAGIPEKANRSTLCYGWAEMPALTPAPNAPPCVR